MTSNIIRIAMVGAASLTVSGCTIPQAFLPEPYSAPAAAPAPAPVVTSAPAAVEPVAQPKRTWGHQPRGADSPFQDGNSSDPFSGLSGGDDDGGWG